MLGILPVLGTISQGKFRVDEQFEYRFNTDKRTIAAALARFQLGLYIFAVASSEAKNTWVTPSRLAQRRRCFAGDSGGVDGRKEALRLSSPSAFRIADLAHDCPWWRSNPRKYDRDARRPLCRPRAQPAAGRATAAAGGISTSSICCFKRATIR